MCFQVVLPSVPLNLTKLSTLGDMARSQNNRGRVFSYTIDDRVSVGPDVFEYCLLNFFPLYGDVILLGIQRFRWYGIRHVTTNMISS
jgi:hypothetical protein